MLATISKLRPVGLVKTKMLRVLSTGPEHTGMSHDTPLPESTKKRIIANEELKAKASAEFNKVTRGLWTIPNVLTMSRIATTPAIGYFIWNGMHYQAMTCFAFAAITDLLDGFIARTFKQDSDIGAVLDPLADKLLLTTCFISLYHIDLMPIWLVKGFIYRDVIIVVGGTVIRYFGFSEPPTLRKFVDFKNYPTLGMEPNFVSKCNTALQCLLVVLHLSTNHLVGIPSYDMSMKGLHLFTAGTATSSLVSYIMRTQIRRFEVKPPRPKK